jgi:hypothetical protein
MTNGRRGKLFSSQTLDQGSARYRRLAARISDEQTLNGIGQLIAELEVGARAVQKRAFHPEQET